MGVANVQRAPASVSMTSPLFVPQTPSVALALQPECS